VVEKTNQRTEMGKQNEAGTTAVIKNDFYLSTLDFRVYSPIK